MLDKLSVAFLIRLSICHKKKEVYPFTFNPVAHRKGVLAILSAKGLIIIIIIFCHYIFRYSKQCSSYMIWEQYNILPMTF